MTIKMNNDKIISDVLEKINYKDYEKISTQEIINLTLQEAQKQSADENYYKDEWMKNLKVTQDLRVELDGLKQQLSNVNDFLYKIYYKIQRVDKNYFPHTDNCDICKIKDLVKNKYEELKTSISKGDVHSQDLLIKDKENKTPRLDGVHTQQENLSEEEITKDKSGWTNPTDTPLDAECNSKVKRDCAQYPCSAPKDNDICECGCHEEMSEECDLCDCKNFVPIKEGDER